MSDRVSQWLEAEILAKPTKPPTEPQVLVRRRTGMLKTVMGEEIIYLSGPAAISLFTGCGGIDIGLERAGYVTLCQHEWSKEACETLIGNRPNFFRHSALIQGDIRQTPTSMLLREAGLYVGDCHIIAGGPPCQGFSRANANSSKGTYDKRNDLVFEFLRVVREAQPKHFVFENVPGFTQFNKGEYMRAFLETAHASGYELVYGQINAVEYLVPQSRCRFLCMGTRRDIVEIDGLIAGLPQPVCFADDNLLRIQILQGLNTPEANEELHNLMRAPGIRYFPDRPVLVPPEIHYNGGAGRSKTFLKFYADLEANEPDRIVSSRQRGLAA